jgi:hypothetical protein
MDTKILTGEKHSRLSESLYDFEHISQQLWHSIRMQCRIPNGFLFLAGVVKYPRQWQNRAPLRFGKDQIFVQNLLPHSDNGGLYQTRGYGALYSFYEPTQLAADDLVLTSSAIYQAVDGDAVRMVLAPNEHRNAVAVGKMFEDICAERGLLEFAPCHTLPALYEVTFSRSCGYFLQGRTYQVWAKPIGIPDRLSAEVNKGWLLADVNCGVPAVLKESREVLTPIPSGHAVGLFALDGQTLVYKG